MQVAGNVAGSLRSADVFPVVASLPPKINWLIFGNFRRERSHDRKYVCASWATWLAFIRKGRKKEEERNNVVARTVYVLGCLNTPLNSSESGNHLWSSCYNPAAIDLEEKGD